MALYIARFESQFLSQKFESCICKLLDIKERAKLYDSFQQENKHEMESAYNNIFMFLRNLNQKLGSDVDKYDRYICDEILSDKVRENGIKSIQYYHLKQLKYLNYIKEENQNIINECLNALDITYVLNKGIYKSIKKNLHKLSTVWEFTLLQIHFEVLMARIYFVWQTNVEMYTPDMIKYVNYASKFDPKIDISQYNYINNITTYFSLNGMQTCELKIKINDIYHLFNYIEKLIVKYVSVNLQDRQTITDTAIKTVFEFVNQINATSQETPNIVIQNVSCIYKSLFKLKS